ncbi:hypothetical protein OV203_01480 [Nannocystis sp. ILAH1]|uniref:hypothetical protein n=1 Tax=Nannocystis sp. ILAH1 TaxID=2996789 RepID=UPI00226E031A|nr:hypothetical protein [Nannocystis sp. ILAH1]MCY0985782.1 hypothetical protein [Nannocystis sp. ILAH1]
MSEDPARPSGGSHRGGLASCAFRDGADALDGEGELGELASAEGDEVEALAGDVDALVRDAGDERQGELAGDDHRELAGDDHRELAGDDPRELAGDERKGELAGDERKGELAGDDQRELADDDQRAGDVGDVGDERKGELAGDD